MTQIASVVRMVGWETESPVILLVLQATIMGQDTAVVNYINMKEGLTLFSLRRS